MKRGKTMAYLRENMDREYLRSLSYEELDVLCSEIREMIINTTAKNGGHLAANLGVVELTVALFRVLDLPADKLLWDVGHQCYTHKILSGRMKDMQSLRKSGGISGFPRQWESAYDLTNGGHSSTAAGLALGMAAARDLAGENYKVCCVVGDGAMTGGPVYECMNNTEATKGGFLMILNDNEMSISENVGSLARVLDKVRMSRGYSVASRIGGGDLRAKIRCRQNTALIEGEHVAAVLLQEHRGEIRAKPRRADAGTATVIGLIGKKTVSAHLRSAHAGGEGRIAVKGEIGILNVGLSFSADIFLADIGAIAMLHVQSAKVGVVEGGLDGIRKSGVPRQFVKAGAEFHESHGDAGLLHHVAAAHGLAAAGVVQQLVGDAE